MHIVNIKSHPLLLLGIVTLLSILSGVAFTAEAQAADLPISSTICTTDGAYEMSSHQSPFRTTTGLCLGDGTNFRYHQFAVKLPQPVSSATIEAKDASGSKIDRINFVRLGSNLYASGEDRDYAGMGYAAPKQPSCSTSDPKNVVTITVTANNSSQTLEPINLCEVRGAGESLIYVTANSIPGDDGGVSSKGSIEGNLGIVRNTSSANRLGLLEKECVTSIQLSGQMNKGGASDGNSDNSWFSLAGGRLFIDNLDEGAYNLIVEYNDALCSGDAGQTTDSLAFSFRDIYVYSGSVTYITDDTGAVQYYNTEGEVVDVTEEAPETAIDTSSCAIEGVGWIVCPTINFLAQFADSAYGFLARNFLEVPASFFDTDGDGKALFEAWRAFLGIANILLVIIFLIIIFSQLTGTGVSNYGVKKMLPRLVIAAILINVSFYVCAIAVDISNIVGYGIKTFLTSLAVADVDPSRLNPGTTGEGGLGMTGTALLALGAGGAFVAGSGGFSLALVALIPIIITAVVALLVIFLTLVIRQVLIILLIALSPLAFAAFLLPNTGHLFKKWRKTFTALLMLFPIIGVVYGASLLASSVITAMYTGTDDGDTLGQIIGAGVLVLPLLVVPSILKKSLDGVEGIGGKISAMGSKIQGQAKARSTSAVNNSRGAKHLQRESALRQAKIQSGAYEGRFGKLNPSNLRSRAYAKFNNSRVSGKFGDLAAAQGAKLEAKERAEDIDAASSRLDAMTVGSRGNERPIDQDLMLGIATGSVRSIRDSNGREVRVDTAMKRAAMAKAAKIATPKQLAQMVDSTAQMDVNDRIAMRDAIKVSSALEQAPWLGGRTLGAIDAGTASSTSAARDFVSQGLATQEFLATAKAPTVQGLYLALSGHAEQRTLVSTAGELLTSPDPSVSELRTKYIVSGGEKEAMLSNVMSGTVPPETPPVVTPGAGAGTTP